MNGFGFDCYYEFCGKAFNNKYNLKRHINAVHLKIQEFKCEFCSKLFLSKIAYKEHRYSHQKIKPLECPYRDCGLRFSRSSLLCKHKKIHGCDEILVKISKKYDKRRDKMILPEVAYERSSAQANAKIPIHHLLIL